MVDKEYLLNQVAKKHAVHVHGYRCTTAAEVEHAWSEKEADEKKLIGTTSNNDAGADDESGQEEKKSPAAKAAAAKAAKAAAAKAAAEAEGK